MNQNIEYLFFFIFIDLLINILLQTCWICITFLLFCDIYFLLYSTPYITKWFELLFLSISSYYLFCFQEIKEAV